MPADWYPMRMPFASPWHAQISFEAAMSAVTVL